MAYKINFILAVGLNYHRWIGNSDQFGFTKGLLITSVPKIKTDGYTCFNFPLKQYINRHFNFDAPSFALRKNRRVFWFARLNLSISHFLFDLYTFLILSLYQPSNQIFFVLETGALKYSLRYLKKHNNVIVGELVNNHTMTAIRRAIKYNTPLGRPPRFNIYNIRRQIEEYRLTDLFICASIEVKQSFLARGYRNDQVVVIPYPLAAANYRPKNLRSSGRLRFMIVGSVIPRKAIHYAVDQLNRIKGLDFSLQLVGPAPDEKYLKLLLQEADFEINHFGPVPNSQVESLISTADLIICSSAEDGFTMISQQAISANSNVIISRYNGACGAFDSRYVFDYMIAGDMERCITNVLESPTKLVPRKILNSFHEYSIAIFKFLQEIGEK